MLELELYSEAGLLVVYKDDSVRTLRTRYFPGGGDYPVPEDVSDVSSEPAIVQAAFNAAKEIEPSFDVRVKYSANSGLLTVGEDSISPYSDLSNLPTEVQAFCAAIWANGGQELYDTLKQIEELSNEA